MPLVHATATGCRNAFANPSAKNALERSSRWTCTVTPACRSNASASGVEREPGDTHAWRIAARDEFVDQGVGAREGDVAGAHHIAGTLFTTKSVCDSASPSASDNPHTA